MSHPRQSVLKLLLTVIFLIPVLTLFALLVRYSVNTPWWDQMSFVDLMTKLHDGKLGINDLWMQHNEHRVMVSRILQLSFGVLTDFNFRVFVMLNFTAACVSLGFLVLLLRRTFKDYRALGLLGAASAWLLFSPFQWVNWLWGFQLAFFLSVCFSILTIWLLTRGNILTNNQVLALAVAAGGVTTYCNGNGLLIWPIGLAILWIQRAAKDRLVTWSAAGIIASGSYLYNFRRSPDSPHLSEIIKEPLAVADYLFTYLGRNLALTQTASKTAGILLVTVLIVATWYIYRSRKLQTMVAWLGLAAFSLLTGLLAAISRLNYGAIHGFESKSYPTYSVIFIIATLVIVTYAFGLWLGQYNKKQLGQYISASFIFGGLVAVALPAVASNYTYGLKNVRELSTHLTSVQTCIYSAQTADDDCLLKIFPDKKAAWRYIDQLKQLGWGDFNSQ